MGEQLFSEIATLLECTPQTVSLDLRVGANHGEVPWERIEDIVGRYAISETQHRGVALFDIVGFSRGSAIEQVAQLSSLEASINVAHNQMQELGLAIDLGRSTTGDGYYIWNRRTGLTADLNLCFLLMLVLAETAIARGEGEPNFVPLLRTCFSVGGHYSYYQVNELNRAGDNYVVGDVTISLARIIEGALPGQILVGDFKRPAEGETEAVDARTFMSRIQEMLHQFHGRGLSKDRITGIRCYFTGNPRPRDRYLINRYSVIDKHGFKHTAYNLRVNVNRGESEPMYLGLRNAELTEFAERNGYQSFRANPNAWGRCSPPGTWIS